MWVSRAGFPAWLREYYITSTNGHLGRQGLGDNAKSRLNVVRSRRTSV